MPERDSTPVHGGKVPLVSEVLDRLVTQAGASSTPRSAMFQAALQVCTEELRHVKKGAQPASLATLVERARYLLMNPGVALHPGSPEPEPVALPKAPAVAPPAPPPVDFEPPFVAPPPHAEEPRPARQAAPGPDDADPFPLAGDHAAPDRLEVDAWPPPPPHPAFEELFAGLAADAATAAGDPTAEPSRRARRFALVGALVFVAAVAAAWFLGLQPRSRRAEAPGAPAAAQPTSAPSAADSFRVAAARPTIAPAAAPVATEPPVPPPAPTATAVPPAPPTAAPVLTRAAPPAEPAMPRRAAPAPPRARPAPPDRTAVMVSPEWSGAPIYALHFSSYHDRDKALADAARIKAAYGQPTHVLQVDLGAEGVWYRVMAGEFASADAASAFRAELVARHVPDVAHIYRVTGPR